MLFFAYELTSQNKEVAGQNKEIGGNPKYRKEIPYFSKEIPYFQWLSVRKFLVVTGIIENFSPAAHKDSVYNIISL